MSTTEERPINSLYLVAANRYVGMLEQSPNRELTRNLAFVLRDYLKEEAAKQEERAAKRKRFLEDMGYLYDMELERIKIGQHEIDEDGNEIPSNCSIGWTSEGGDECGKDFRADTIEVAVHAAAEWLREQIAKWEEPAEYQHPVSPIAEF